MRDAWQAGDGLNEGPKEKANTYPMKRVGVKTPPTAPEPNVAQVATFQNQNSGQFLPRPYPGIPHSQNCNRCRRPEDTRRRKPTIKPPDEGARKLGHEKLKPLFRTAKGQHIERRQEAAYKTQPEHYERFRRGTQHEMRDRVKRISADKLAYSQVATTEEQTSGPKTPIDIVPMTTSATKSAPDTGAL